MTEPLARLFRVRQLAANRCYDYFWSSLDPSFDLQTFSHRLVVVRTTISRSTSASTSFHIRFDFHSVFPFLQKLRLIARLQPPICIWPFVAPALTFVLSFTVVFPFYENRCWLHSPTRISPLVAPALTFALIFIVFFLSLKIEVDC